MNRLSILLFIAFIFLAESQASNLLSPPDSSIVPSIYKRNNIQLELGGLLVIGGATLSYERMFSKTRYTSKRGLALTGFQKVSAGGWYSWGSEGGSLKYQTGLLLGINDKHLEIAGGGWLMHTINPCCGEKLLSPWPTATFAYRKQKPKSNAIFRIGSTFPELFFVSWGKSFYTTYTIYYFIFLLFQKHLGPDNKVLGCYCDLFRFTSTTTFCGKLVLQLTKKCFYFYHIKLVRPLS